MKTQKHPVGNKADPAVLQINFGELFEAAHEHPVKSAFPSPTDGAVRDIVVVDDGTNVYACFKTSRGWFRTAALTAI